MISRLRLFMFPAAMLFSLLLAACGTMPHQKVDTVSEYGNAVRWSDWDIAWNFLDPEARVALSLPESEAERLKDVKVTGYLVRAKDPQPDGTVRQVVEISYVDIDTQVEKKVRDVQVWRSIDEGKTWMLVSGLPEF